MITQSPEQKFWLSTADTILMENGWNDDNDGDVKIFRKSYAMDKQFTKFWALQRKYIVYWQLKEVTNIRVWSTINDILIASDQHMPRKIQSAHQLTHYAQHLQGRIGHTMSGHHIHKLSYVLPAHKAAEQTIIYKTQNQGCQVGSIMHKFLRDRAASTRSVTPLCTDCRGPAVLSSWRR